MPRPDKRCHHKIRQTQDFYLFKKHQYIYYAFYPSLNITRSTKQTNIHQAYIEAYDILEHLIPNQNQSYYKTFDNKKLQRDLSRALQFVDQSKPLTSNIIASIQNRMQAQGLAGKSINNYIYVLRRAYTDKFPEFTPVESKSQYRSCFPIKSFYGFWTKCSTRLDYLAFFAMTTGCRAGEIYSCEPYEDGYMKINGTKTKNAVRVIPVLPETLACLEYLKGGFKTAAYKESVVRAGSLCGFDEDYIEQNHIVFHSFRKMYKTLLVSANINTQYSEYLLGHSQTRTVCQLYFVAESMDRDEYDRQVLEALRRFV